MHNAQSLKKVYYTMSLIQSVRWLASGFPDALYQASRYCEYTKGKCGPGFGCIIGQGMQNCGMRDVAKAADSAGETAINYLFLETKVANKNDLAWLTKVQRAQDAGRRWADAVRLADAFFS
jgi:hypothetical protein